MKASKGVYSILCAATGVLYFGSSMRSIENRFSWHRSMLKHGKHNTPGLMQAYEEHGAESFIYQYEFITDDPIAAMEEERNLILRYESYNHYFNPDADFSARNEMISIAHEATRKTQKWKDMQSELAKKQHEDGKFGTGRSKRIYHGA
jgi:hypothetical protein